MLRIEDIDIAAVLTEPCVYIVFFYIGLVFYPVQAIPGEFILE